MKKFGTPVYLGRIACELGISLSEAHVIVNKLVSDGTIRKAQRSELDDHLIDDAAALYIFVTAERK